MEEKNKTMLAAARQITFEVSVEQNKQSNRYLKGIGEAGEIALGDSCDIVRQGDNNGPVLTKLEVICNNIVGVLLDLVLIMPVFDTTEVPGDNIRSRTRHNSLFRFI